MRGCYCALAACEMLGLDKGALAAACAMPDFIRRCQARRPTGRLLPGLVARCSPLRPALTPPATLPSFTT